MSNLSNFLERVGKEPALRERLDSINMLLEAERATAFIALSEECGTSINADELPSASSGELSDAHLEGVSGGQPGLPNSFVGLPMEDLIGGLLNAAANAQKQFATSTTAFIKSIEL